MGNRERAVFTWARQGDEETTRTVARFRCNVCRTAILDITRGSIRAPELMCEKARTEGWEASIHSAASVICPDCIAKREARRKGESPGKKAALHIVRAQPIIEKGSTVVAMTNNPVRTPSVEERRLMRDALISFFNEEAGNYTSGYSDEKIATEINVPRKWVTEMREAFFGSLKEPPEIAALNARLSTIADNLAKREGDQVTVMERCTALSTEIAALKTSLSAVHADIASVKKKLGFL